MNYLSAWRGDVVRRGLNLQPLRYPSSKECSHAENPVESDDRGRRERGPAWGHSHLSRRRVAAQPTRLSWLPTPDHDGRPRIMYACSMPDSSELKKPIEPSGERNGWMWAPFCQEQRGLSRYAGSRPAGPCPARPVRPDRSARRDPPARRRRSAARRRCRWRSGRSAGWGNVAAQVVAHAAGRLDAQMARRAAHARPSISWASGGLCVAGAGDGPVAAAAPALVALADLVAVAAPGHVAEVACRRRG